MANSYQSTRPRSGFRQRRKSGDDVCLPMSGNNPEQSSIESTNRFGVFLDSFRPRSKSDATKSMRRSNIISSMKSGVHRSLTGSAIILDSETAVSLPTSPHAMDAPDGSGAGIRLRSGSESSKTSVRSVMDRIRGRPTVTTELEKRKFSKSNSSISSASVSASLYRRHDEPFRRRSLSGSDAANDHNRMAFIFRDSRGLPVVDPFIDTLNSNEINGDKYRLNQIREWDPSSSEIADEFRTYVAQEEDEAQIYVRFFKFHKCYDLIPTSAKLVVFDTLLRVKKAFFALVYNGVRAAPLWDSNQQRFVGMLTITDFIHILKAYYRKPNEKMEELEEHKLDTWRTVLASRSKPLISISPEEPLFTAISTLLVNKIHRLPVIDPVSGDVLYIITHKRILRFLHLYLDELPRPSFLENTLEDLKLGTYDNIETATFDTPVIDALTKFVSRRISALPIVDQEGKLVHIYAKFDVINLAAERIYDQLHLPLKDVISHRSENVVEYCQITHTLNQVIDQLVRAEVHRLVVTDAERRVIGVVSLSDILEAMIIRPQDYARTCRDTSTEGFSAVGSHTSDVTTHTGLLVSSDDVILQESHRTIPEEDGTEDEQISSATDALADESEG